MFCLVSGTYARPAAASLTNNGLANRALISRYGRNNLLRHATRADLIFTIAHRQELLNNTNLVLTDGFKLLRFMGVWSGHTVKFKIQSSISVHDTTGQYVCQVCIKLEKYPLTSKFTKVWYYSETIFPLSCRSSTHPLARLSSFHRLLYFSGGVCSAGCMAICFSSAGRKL